jgi:hypothetical protein
MVGCRSKTPTVGSLPLLLFPQFLPSWCFSFFQSPNHDTIEKIISNIDTFGANHPNHPSKQERGLFLLIANKEEKLETLEARRTALLQELDRIGEEITHTRVELDKAKSLLLTLMYC